MFSTELSGNADLVEKQVGIENGKDVINQKSYKQ